VKYSFEFRNPYFFYLFKVHGVILAAHLINFAYIKQKCLASKVNRAPTLMRLLERCNKLIPYWQRQVRIVQSYSLGGADLIHGSLISHQFSPNSMSIGLAVYAEQMAVTNTNTYRPRYVKTCIDITHIYALHAMRVNNDY